jgi:beta-glucosidase
MAATSSAKASLLLFGPTPQPEPPLKHVSTNTAATTRTDDAFDLQSDDDVGSTVDARAPDAEAGDEVGDEAATADEAIEMLDEEQGSGLAGIVSNDSRTNADRGEQQDDGGITTPLVNDEASSDHHGNVRPRQRHHFLPSVSGLRSSTNRAFQQPQDGSHAASSAARGSNINIININIRKDSNDYIDDIDLDLENSQPPPSPLRAADLTLPEKLLLVSGKSLWTLNDLQPRIPSHILPSLRLSDGPHGVRKPLSEMNLQQSHPATCFPTAAALACSWDGRLLQKVGVALRLECLHYGISILLGPGINLKRHAAGGRNFEYFSEDPLLTARCAAFYIHGIQATGQVAACAKHYAVNNQESHRFVVNAKIDERTCRELYLRHFEYICKAPQETMGKTSSSSSSSSVLELGLSAIPATLMCSYNKVNGVHCSEHSVLLNDILRREWGYQGVVMTDWGATNNRALGIKASLDLEMPGSHGAHNGIIRKALKTSSSAAAAASSSSRGNHGKDDGDPDNPIVSLSELDHLDPCVDRILNLIHELRDSSPDAAVHASATTTNNNNNNATTNTPATTVDWASHHELAKQVAMECAVLLKNDDNLLPLRRNTSVAVIGDFAKDHPRYQGMGSSQVFSECVVSALTEFKSYTNQVYFSKGYHAGDEHFSHQQEQQQNSQDGDDDNDDEMWIDTELLDQAVQVAQKAEVVILFIGLPALMESEGFDRPHLSLPAQHNALVHEICRVHKKVVVVLSNGGAVEMPWANEPQAIFEGYLLGEMGGAAVVELIFGQQSPCGKLAETVPIRQSDILADAYFPGTSDGDGYCVEHREGLQVGYRYFDSVQYKSVRFPFGHGLTYTTFDYSDLKVNIRQDDEATKVVDVSFSLTNNGNITGKAVVVQLLFS